MRTHAPSRNEKLSGNNLIPNHPASSGRGNFVPALADHAPGQVVSSWIGFPADFHPNLQLSISTASARFRIAAVGAKRNVEHK